MALGTSLPARMPLSTGTVYFVDPANTTGAASDSYTTTQAQVRTTPWLTISHAIGAVSLTGSIIKVLPCTVTSSGYSSFPIQFARAGVVTNPVTIMAETPGTVTLRGSAAAGSTITVWAHDGSGLRVQDMIIDSVSGSAGSDYFTTPVQVENFDKFELLNCTIYEGDGINVRGGDAGSGLTADDVWILNCIFRPKGTDQQIKVTGLGFTISEYYGSKGSHWIYAGQYGTTPGSFYDTANGCRRLVVANCIFVGSAAGRHVQLGPQARDSYIVGNTFYSNHIFTHIGNTGDYGTKYAGSGVQLFQESQTNTLYMTGNAYVKNNIFVDLDGHALYDLCNGGGCLIDHNLAYQCRNNAGYDGNASNDYDKGSGYGASDTIGTNAANSDPKFFNAAAYDFHLLSGSPAIGVGDSVYAFPTDRDGTARSDPPSLGAYATGGTPPPSVIGKNTVGASLSTALAQNFKIGSLASITSPTSVNRIRWYLAGGASAQAVRAQLYLFSASVPQGLLVTSAEVVIPAGAAAGWVNFPIPVTTLSPGSIVISLLRGPVDGQITAYFDSGGSSWYNADTYADGPADPFGTPTGPLGTTYSAYVDFASTTLGAVPLDTAWPGPEGGTLRTVSENAPYGTSGQTLKNTPLTAAWPPT